MLFEKIIIFDSLINTYNCIFLIHFSLATVKPDLKSDIFHIDTIDLIIINIILIISLIWECQTLIVVLLVIIVSCETMILPFELGFFISLTCKKNLIVNNSYSDCPIQQIDSFVLILHCALIIGRDYLSLLEIESYDEYIIVWPPY